MDTNKVKAKKLFVSEIKSQIKHYKKLLQDVEQTDSRECNQKEYKLDDITSHLKQSVNELVALSNYPSSNLIDSGIRETNKLFFNLMLLRYSLVFEKSKENWDGYVSKSEKVFQRS